MIKIMLVDDHAIVREGYVRLIHSQPEMQVSEADAKRMAELIMTLKPAN